MPPHCLILAFLGHSCPIFTTCLTYLSKLVQQVAIISVFFTCERHPCHTQALIHGDCVFLTVWEVALFSLLSDLLKSDFDGRNWLFWLGSWRRWWCCQRPQDVLSEEFQYDEHIPCKVHLIHTHFCLLRFQRTIKVTIFFSHELTLLKVTMDLTFIKLLLTRTLKVLSPVVCFF